MTEKSYIFKPVKSGNWKDLENLFEDKGGPHNCWCMLWRKMKSGTANSRKAGKKESMKDYVYSKIPVGLLCYHQSEPIAWCSVAPRDSYKNLSGDTSLENVWSLVCFFIKREYRGEGITEKLVTEAMKYAKKNGADYMEAYPVDPDSPSYRFMGFKPLFERSGFQLQKKVGLRRYVMIIKL